MWKIVAGALFSIAFLALAVSGNAIETSTNSNPAGGTGLVPRVYRLPMNPQLRVDLGMHSAPVDAMSIDTKDGILVSGSDDKTVRIWELPNKLHSDLESVEVLRPPVGEPKIGEVYATAISPDGTLVAVAGYMYDAAVQMAPGISPFYVYLFSRQTGLILKALPVEQTTFSLAFSPDGRHLAAGFGGGWNLARGLRVWCVEGCASRWSEIKVDRDFGGTVNSVAFSRDGRLAALSANGDLKVYDTNFALVAQTALTKGRVAHGLSFSPQGSLIAVGYYNAPVVTVLASASLAASFELGGAGEKKQKGGLSAIAWSGDGTYLYAGGPSNGAPTEIYRWRVSGKEQQLAKPIDLGLRNSVEVLLPYGQTGVIVATSDPVIAAYNYDGKEAFPRLGFQGFDLREGHDASAIAAYEDALQVSVGGRQIRFGSDAEKQVTFDFDLPGIVSGNSPAKLVAPLLEAQAFTINNWFYTWDPNGPTIQRLGSSQTYPLEPDHSGEQFNALAVAPSGQWFVLGTDSFVSLYTSAGKRVSRIHLPVPARVVNVTPDERFVVAVCDDNIVRWFTVHDGNLKLVLNLFVYRPDGRWIAWTPEGYYDASANGENLIGWLVNKSSTQAALFYGASLFQATYRRPEIIQNVLKSGVSTAVPRNIRATFLKNLPPVVHIVGITQSGASEARIKYWIETPSHKPVTDMRVLVNGALVARAKSVDELEIPLAQAKGRIEISVSAASVDGFGAPAKETFTPQLSLVSPRKKPDLYALVVGVRKFQDPTIPPLQYAAADASDIAKILGQEAGRFYRHVYVTKLLDNNATRSEIVDTLVHMETLPTKNDVSILFFSGHGAQAQDPVTRAYNGHYYFVPWDFRMGHMASTGVGYTDVLDYLGHALGLKLVFIDTCYAARLGDFQGRGLVGLLGTSESAMIWASSSSSKEESWEPPGLGNGAFTAALLQAFQGRANAMYYTQDHTITQHALTLWVDNRVPVLSQYHQVPSTFDPGPPMAIASVVAGPR